MLHWSTLYIRLKCDYITLLDDNDYFDKNTLLEAKRVINKNPEKKWFVSRRVAENRENITKIESFGTVPYIDYYLGITMIGDATHLIHTSLFGNTRFSKQFKQAEEWVFFMDLAGRSKMFTYNFPSTICTYLDNGLSAQAKKKKRKQSDQELAVEKLGYRPSTVEVMKLSHRINTTIASKRFPKLLRYLPRYLYWKIRESLS